MADAAVISGAISLDVASSGRTVPAIGNLPRKRRCGRPEWTVEHVCLRRRCSASGASFQRRRFQVPKSDFHRFAKILRFGRARYNIGLDVINVTNSNAILTYNQNFNPAVTAGAQAWLAPLSVLTPRFVKLGAQIDF
jgi:hypothetical protein